MQLHLLNASRCAAAELRKIDEDIKQIPRSIELLEYTAPRTVSCLHCQTKPPMDETQLQDLASWKRIYTVFRKKTPTHIFFHISMNYLWIWTKLKNCTEYTQGSIDSDNVKIKYSLRSMTKLWRHIFLAKVGASLQHAINRDLKDIIFLRVQETCSCIDAVVSCIVWWNLRQ